MSKALLLVPHFWDPICVPLSISSLKSYAERHGHSVDLYDFNTNNKIFSQQSRYFDLGLRQFPYWKNWNMLRNGTEMLALHQLVYLFAKHDTNYPELVAEILNMDDRSTEEFMSSLDTAVFNEQFDELYNDIRNIIVKLLNKSKPDVVGCYLTNSTWAATLFILRTVKE